MRKRHKKLVHEGEYAAEVEVELITIDDGWAPYLNPENEERLDSVRDDSDRVKLGPQKGLPGQMPANETRQAHRNFDRNLV